MFEESTGLENDRLSLILSSKRFLISVQASWKPIGQWFSHTKMNDVEDRFTRNP